mmetsp:Transcript_25046/g.75331  ORF Transcript_25046/g.75331 Transcript_25046/m.75331 type:complete len:236 (-) Transcript_25046:472-1179(-)
MAFSKYSVFSVNEPAASDVQPGAAAASSSSSFVSRLALSTALCWAAARSAACGSTTSTSVSADHDDHWRFESRSTPTRHLISHPPGGRLSNVARAHARPPSLVHSRGGPSASFWRGAFCPPYDQPTLATTSAPTTSSARSDRSDSSTVTRSSSPFSWRVRPTRRGFKGVRSTSSAMIIMGLLDFFFLSASPSSPSAALCCATHEAWYLAMRASGSRCRSMRSTADWSNVVFSCLT